MLAYRARTSTITCTGQCSHIAGLSSGRANTYVDNADRADPKVRQQASIGQRSNVDERIHNSTCDEQPDSVVEVCNTERGAA